MYGELVFLALFLLRIALPISILFLYGTLIERRKLSKA
jgi:hypothetical protein